MTTSKEINRQDAETPRKKRIKFILAPWRLGGSLNSSSFQDAGGAQTGALAAVDLVPAHLLDGGEIVILAIKPSLWYVVFVSIRWLLGMVGVIVLAGWLRDQIPMFTRETIVQGALLVGAGRVGFAMLQWVSRLYVLTNRRVLRLTGIANVDLFECQLTKIQNTYLTMAWYERLAGLGTISFATAGTGGIEASWINVNNPLEVHERVRSAIHRMQFRGNGI